MSPPVNDNDVKIEDLAGPLILISATATMPLLEQYAHDDTISPDDYPLIVLRMHTHGIISMLSAVDPGDQPRLRRAVRGWLAL